MSIFSNHNNQDLDIIIYEKWLKVIEEKLSLSQFRDLWKNIKQKWNRSKWEALFKSQPYEKDKNAYRIYIPLEKDGPNIIPNKNVSILLDKLGYEIQDYKAGLAKEKNGKRVMKIGKLLNNNPDVLKMFINDPARAAVKKKQLVVISRHPYDIAGMSTDRGWSSCMNLVTGINKHYVPIDIVEGTIIAYLIDETDKNIQNPSARILIKPFLEIGTKEIALGIQDKVYGTASSDFVKTVKKWVDGVNASRNLYGVFQLPTFVYNDAGNSQIVLTGKNIDIIAPKTPKEAFAAAIKNKKKVSYDLERLIAKDYKYAFEYANKILHSRFKEGEDVIASDPEYSYKYATEVLKGRFQKGERVISTNIDFALLYIKEFGNVLPYIPKEQILRDIETFSTYYKLTGKLPNGWKELFLKKIKTLQDLIKFEYSLDIRMPEIGVKVVNTPEEAVNYTKLLFYTSKNPGDFIKSLPPVKLKLFLSNSEFLELYVYTLKERPVDYEKTLSLANKEGEQKVLEYIKLLKTYLFQEGVNNYLDTLDLQQVAKTTLSFRKALRFNLNVFKPSKNIKQLYDIVYNDS